MYLLRLEAFIVFIQNCDKPTFPMGGHICSTIAVVTLQTFTKVKPIYQPEGKFIKLNPPEVNSSRVLFYLGKKSWECHTSDIGSQVFQTQLNFLERKLETFFILLFLDR